MIRYEKKKHYEEFASQKITSTFKKLQINKITSYINIANKLKGNTLHTSKIAKTLSSTILPPKTLTNGYKLQNLSTFIRIHK